MCKVVMVLLMQPSLSLLVYDHQNRTNLLEKKQLPPDDA